IPDGPARTPDGPARTPDGTGRTPDGAARTPDSTDGRPLAAVDVLTASAAEPDLDQLASEFVAELAFHVVNLAILVNPVRIAVGGGPGSRRGPGRRRHRRRHGNPPSPINQ